MISPRGRQLPATYFTGSQRFFRAISRQIDGNVGRRRRPVPSMASSRMRTAALPRSEVRVRRTELQSASPGDAELLEGADGAPLKKSIQSKEWLAGRGRWHDWDDPTQKKKPRRSGARVSAFEEVDARAPLIRGRRAIPAYGEFSGPSGCGERARGTTRRMRSPPAPVIRTLGAEPGCTRMGLIRARRQPTGSTGAWPPRTR